VAFSAALRNRDQTKRLLTPPHLDASLAEVFQKALPVVVVLTDRQLAPTSPIHHIINRVGKRHA
jgi:hypothetical protein